MKYEEMERKIYTAGAWFTGAFIGEFVLNCNDKRVSQDAVENAVTLLDKICRDEIELL